MLYLTEILGLPVIDSSGKKVGKVTELAVAPVVQPSRVAILLLKNTKGKPTIAVPFETVSAFSPEEIRLRVAREELKPFQPDEALLLLRKDLLDQQIIDVNGRKVVRVNDLSFSEQVVNGHTELLLSEVDIGLSGAVRRLLHGALPRAWLRKLESHVKGTAIRWEFVDLLEADPLRQVKLNISHKVLRKLHPADLADIMEELAPKERQAIFTALDDATAAAALSEIPQKLQVSILESLGKTRAANILEEMPPDAAADLLAELPAETSNELLQDMDREEAAELGELLEFPENSAGGRMTTDYVAIPSTADVGAARDLIRGAPELPENFATIFLVDTEGKLVGMVALAQLIVAEPQTSLEELQSEPLLSIPAQAPEEDIVELFDKYNLLSLPVVDEEQILIGVVTVDDIVSVLRKQS
ncbi:MAG: CBS domain-containing protein [Acidobacteria bacterium]|nr:CBS domain-containing protein [Acidobacteriota bacterium]